MLRCKNNPPAEIIIKRTVGSCFSCFVLKGFVVTGQDPVKNDLNYQRKGIKNP